MEHITGSIVLMIGLGLMGVIGIIASLYGLHRINNRPKTIGEMQYDMMVERIKKERKTSV